MCGIVEALCLPKLVSSVYLFPQHYTPSHRPIRLRSCPKYRRRGRHIMQRNPRILPTLCYLLIVNSAAPANLPLQPRYQVEVPTADEDANPENELGAINNHPENIQSGLEHY